jgi:hypothetical protein
MSFMEKLTLGLLVFMGSILAFEHWHVKSLESDLTGYKIQLTQLQLDSKKQHEEAQDAYKVAINQMGQIQDTIGQVMNTPVSNDCNLAMAWMASKAHDL